MRFADDIVLISKSREEIKQMVIDLMIAIEEAGLKMNTDKTKYMSNSSVDSLSVNEIEIELVDEYTYLGQLIAFEQRLNKELQVRRKKAWKGYWALRQVFKSKMQLTSKIRILDSCIIPSLIYGAQTWSLTKSQARSLQITQRSMEPNGNS